MFYSILKTVAWTVKNKKKKTAKTNSNLLLEFRTFYGHAQAELVLVVHFLAYRFVPFDESKNYRFVYIFTTFEPFEFSAIS